MTTDELNRDIWQPFVKVYAARDTEAFAALHAPELVRVEAAGPWSGGRAAYVERVRGFFDDMTARGGEIDIAFRFVERIVGDQVASERGVYRIGMVLPGEDPTVFYGRFHTFARDTGEGWRIVVDYDAADAGETDFAAAAGPDGAADHGRSG